MARYITALAPIRICDCGGWTDTWFAGHGRVCHIAVSPYVEVQIAVEAHRRSHPRAVVHAENFGTHHVADPAFDGPSPHPLIDAAIAHVGIPDDVAIEVTIHSEVPAGASTGTSAAVTVALVGALEALASSRRTTLEIAYTAHAIEADRLGRQSGIQDQLCAALGGIGFLEIAEYPRAHAEQVPVPAATRWELERRLLLVSLGRTHDSSVVHREVIARIQGDPNGRGPLDTLRATAIAARDALVAGNLAAFGRAMCEATEGQAALHPALVSAEARALIALASAHEAVGWKVNGAGGDGGSLTLLTGPSASGRRALQAAIAAAGEGWQVIPIRLAAEGLRVWQT
jgi:D-glycero-alpha-D-manno-heptose-7-phosphate kinase